MTAAGSSYPLRYDVEYPECLSRWKIFVKWLLAIPHTLILGALGMVAYVMTVIAWFAILFTGRYPQGLFNFVVGVARWNANVSAYAALLRDEYPPFGSGPYPVTFEVDYPERSNRWTVAFRLILAIPQLIVLLFVLLAWLVTVVIAWFAILFTGRYPEGLYSFGVGVQRWTLRVQAYLLLVRDKYPPFSLE